MTSISTPRGAKNSPLTVEDVCRILKSSEESGITKLKFRDLEFERQAVITRPTPDPVPTEYAIPEEIHKKQNEQALLTDELRTKRDQIDELVITDPLRYEQMIADGELVLEEDTEDGDSGE